ncbi:MAG: tetratricopeptide repeat protein [Acidobacteriota bacterium]|nr:tetratricopeptide repeat protein [Acidobacteriota bacterium]
MSQSFTREAALRLLHVSERQLKSWERQKLVEPVAVYSFRELLALRTLIKLRESKVPPQQIRRALQALTKKLRGVDDPLTELKLYADGKKIRVELEGHAMEAESGQLLLDFDRGELSRLLEFRPKENPRAAQDQRQAAEHWFQRGLDLEATGAPLTQIIEAYEKAIELDPGSAGALVNLGTIYFNTRNFTMAERFYTLATETDPEYALAHFDLGNLCDECGDRGRALEHYLAALRISPNYADAHYNIALLYQGARQNMKAVRHWTAYLKLDPSSEWAGIARRELDKLREAAVVRGR